MAQQPPLPPSLPNSLAPTLVQELETANTLLDLHDSNNKDTGQTESNITVTTPAPAQLFDAMDKIVGYSESPESTIYALKSTDAMYSITRKNLEPVNPVESVLNALNVETAEQNTDMDLPTENQDQACKCGNQTESMSCLHKTLGEYIV